MPRGMLFYRLLQQSVNTDPHPLHELIVPKPDAVPVEDVELDPLPSNTFGEFRNASPLKQISSTYELWATRPSSQLRGHFNGRADNGRADSGRADRICTCDHLTPS